MSKSSQAARTLENVPFRDLSALHAYIDSIVAERLAAAAGSPRSAAGQATRGNDQESDDDDATDNAHGLADGGDIEDSEDEELPPLLTRSPSLAGVDLELVDALGQIRLSVPEVSLSPTSSNLVPAEVRDRVLEAMARESSAGGRVDVIVSPGSGGAQAAPQSAPQPVAPAPVVAAPARRGPPGFLTQSTAEYVPHTGPVPAARPLIPGFHSLAGTPPPPPEQAVFAGPNDGPFYVVTRGTRVGVMGGWDTVSPYVTKVSGAIHQKKGTLMAAYCAYHQAYYQYFSPKYI